ncbi:MAG TPA: hypothetical protein VII33_15015, partial [Nakamurella sp.]
MTVTSDSAPGRSVTTGQAPGLSSGYRVARARQLVQLRQQAAGVAPDQTVDVADDPAADTSVTSAPADPSQKAEPPIADDAAGRWPWPAVFRRLPRRSPVPAHTATVPAGAAASFDVPLPGKRQHVGRTRSWVTRLALVAAPLVLIGGVAYSCGVSTGSSRLIQSSDISPDDAAAFHLSSYPTQRAAAFGVSYLTLCLTHPDRTDETGTTDRLAALAGMSSAGVSPGCGWTGTSASKAPLSVTWDGTAKPTQATYTVGAAALLGFVVTLPDGRTVGAAFPIWVSSTDTPASLRVVGDIALIPIAPAAAAPTPAAQPLTDTTIPESLTGSVLLPFLRAWAASDQVQLNLVLARDASTAARAGMDDQLAAPVVNRTQVVVNRGDPEAYRDGDLITALTAVDWTTRAGGVQRAGYSIVLRLTAGRWQVVDITGAPPDPAGGAAPGT